MSENCSILKLWLEKLICGFFYDYMIKKNRQIGFSSQFFYQLHNVEKLGPNLLFSLALSKIK